MQEEKQKILEQFQTYQQQLQALLFQKESLKMQKIEMERALDELNACKQEFGYKIVGNVMIQKSIENLKSELKESIDEINIRLKAIERSENKIVEKLRELQTKIGELK